MGETKDIGRRVELVSMDPHGGGISIGLYERAGYLVHTFSRNPGAAERIGFVESAMIALGGMQRGSDGRLRFPCGDAHETAARRLFLEAARLPSSDACQARPLSTLDRKSNEEVRVTGLGGGSYEVSPGPRAESAAGGLAKLGRLHAVEGASTRVHFPCGHPHDALIGLLLVRALNVRAALREMELAAARGVLAAPSAQR